MGGCVYKYLLSKNNNNNSITLKIGGKILLKNIIFLPLYEPL